MRMQRIIDGARVFGAYLSVFFLLHRVLLNMTSDECRRLMFCGVPTAIVTCGVPVRRYSNDVMTS